MRTQGAFFRRVLLLIAGVAVLTTGGAVAWGRRTNDPAGCLSAEIDDTRLVIDVQQGQWHLSRLPIPDQLISATSPNGRFQAHLRWSPTGDTIQFTVNQLPTGATASAGGQTVVQAELESVAGMKSPRLWMLDNERILVVWADKLNRTHVRLYSMAGIIISETQVAPNFAIIDPIEATFSADGQYVLLSELERVNHVFRVFSLPTLQLTFTTRVTRTGSVSIPQWSPGGHWLAWMEADNSDGLTASQLWLAIMSPETGEKRMQLPLIGPNLSWQISGMNSTTDAGWRWWRSPANDEVRTLFSYLDPDWRLVSFDTQGKARNELTIKHERIRPFNGSSYLAFSSDETQVMYLRPIEGIQVSTNQPPMLSEAVSYNFATRIERRVLSNVLAEEWQVPSKVLRYFDGELKRIIVPTWNEGKTDVQLLSTDGVWLRTLAYGVAETHILEHSGNWPLWKGQEPPFLVGGKWLSFLWTDAADQATLVWASVDGKIVNSLPLGLFDKVFIGLSRYDPHSQTLVVEKHAYDNSWATQANEIYDIDLNTGVITPLVDHEIGGWVNVWVAEAAEAGTENKLAQRTEWFGVWKTMGQTSPSSPTQYLLDIHHATRNQRFRMVTELDMPGISAFGNRVRLYLSPDQRSAIVSIELDFTAEVAITSIESPTAIWRRTHLGLDTPAYDFRWSDDGTQFALLSDLNGKRSFELRSERGELLRSASLRPFTRGGRPVKNLRWTECR